MPAKEAMDIIFSFTLADLGGGAHPARAPPHLPGILVHWRI